MSDLEQSPAPPVPEIIEPGSGPRVTPVEPEAVPLPRSEPPSDREPPSDTVTRKRSSIRPAPPGWRPSEARSRPPAPMVVVYSGDSDRPAPTWQTEQPTPRGPSVRGTRADETGPFLPVHGFYRKTLPSGLFDALMESGDAASRPDSEQRSVEVEPASAPELTEVEARSSLEPASVPSTAPEPEQRSVPVALEQALAVTELDLTRASLARPNAPVDAKPQLALEPPAAVVDPGATEASSRSAAARASAITARELKSPLSSQRNPPQTSAQNTDTRADARTQPTLRLPRVQPAARRVPSIAPAAPTAASVSAAKALAARGMPVSGRPPPEAVRLPGVPRSWVIGLWTLAVCLGLFLIQRARLRAGNEHPSAPLVAVVEPSRALPPQPVQTSVAKGEAQTGVSRGAAPQGDARSTEPVAPPGALLEPQAAPEPKAAAAPTSSTANRTVKLEVMPPDAKVFVKGLLRKGPPFVFEVRPGGRVIAEVVRPGYVARRVVLDGSKPDFAVGLLRRATPPRPRPDAAVAAGVEPTEARGTVVQSGL